MARNSYIPFVDVPLYARDGFDPTDADMSHIGFLQYIREGRIHSMKEMLALWDVTQTYEAVETILDIAEREHMPLWAAWAMWNEWWKAYQKENPDH